jgi:hypothetical protein
MMEPNNQNQPTGGMRLAVLGVVVSVVLGGFAGVVVGGTLGNNRDLLVAFGNNPPRKVNFFGERVTPDRVRKGIFSLCGLWAFAAGAVINWITGRVRGIAPGRWIRVPRLSGGPPRPIWVNLAWSDTLLGSLLWIVLQVALIAAAIGILQLRVAQAHPGLVGAVGSGLVGLLLGALGGWVTSLMELRRQENERQGVSGL